MPKKNDGVDPKESQTGSSSNSNGTPKPKRVPTPKPEAPKMAAAKPESTIESEAAKPAEFSVTTGDTTTEPKSNPLSRIPVQDWKKLALRAAIVLVTLIIIVVLVFGVLIYGYKNESKTVRNVSAVIPYPAQMINGSFVTYHDYLFEVEANKRAYQNNAKLNNQPAVDYNSAEGKKLVKQIKEHALDKLKNDTVTAQLASQKKVKVTDKEVNDLLSELYKRYGGKDTLLKTLDQIYGWNLNDLKSVVRKQLLAKKLEEKVTSDPALDAQAKAKAQDVLKKVKDGGDFAALAKQYSQASDASSGGDLGSFTKGQLPEEVQKAVDALQPGQVSDAVKTTYGYELIKVLEKTGDTTHAQHILITTIDFNNYMTEQLKKAKVNAYIKV